ARSMHFFVWSMCCCRFSFSGQTKFWWIERKNRSRPSEKAIRFRLFRYFFSSLSIWRCRISTPSKPIRAAFSMTFSIGYLTLSKSQYEEVETPMRIGCVDLAVCVVSARESQVMIEALATAPVLIKSRRDNFMDSLLSSEIGIVSLIRHQLR